MGKSAQFVESNFRKYSLVYAVSAGVQDSSSVCDGFCYQTIKTSGKIQSDPCMSENIAL